MPKTIIRMQVVGAATYFGGPIAGMLANVALNKAFKALRLGTGPRNQSDEQVEIRQAVGSRKRHYGIVHTSGLLTFMESRDGTLGKVITLGTGREGTILEHRLLDRVVTLDGSGTVEGDSYRGAIHIYTRSGTDDQTAISELTTAFPEWTSDHRQRGCAHVAIVGDAVKQERFQEVYNGQMPMYSQVRQAGFLYDARLDSTAVIGTDGSGDPVYGDGPCRLDDPGTWPWSDNAALVIGDYVAHRDGYGLGYDSVNWANIAAEADHCDAEEITVTAETIARWRIWGTYSLAEDVRSEILANMLIACDGFCWQDADGKFNLMTGRWEEPDITLTDDHIISMTAERGPLGLGRTNAVKVIYTEAAIGYREQESATLTDPDTPEGPSTDAETHKANYAPHHNQGVRLGKLVLAERGDRWRINANINLFGLNLLGRRFTRLTSADLGVDAFFKIEDLQLELIGQRGGKGPTITARLTEVRPEDWEFNAALEEGDPPLAPGTSYTPPTVDAPTGLAAAGVQIALGETNAVAIEASWADPGREGFSYEAQYRPTAGGTWVAMAVDSDARTARSGPVSSGVSYDVQVRALTISGRASDWSAVDTVTPSSTPTIGSPTALGAIGGTAEADVSFSMPTSPTVTFARLYSDNADDFGGATQVGSDIVAAPGALVSINHSGLSTGTQYYWARAFDGSGGSSALAGPVAATIS